MTHTETVSGTLAQIRFHQEGFLIAQLASGASVKGSMQAPQLGSEYEFEGRWFTDPRYGPTFLFKSYRRKAPQDPAAIRIYLEANLEGVGPILAERIVGRYGQESLVILKDQPDRVAEEIAGITPQMAKAMADCLKALEKVERLEIAINEVLGSELSPRLRRRVIEIWGDAAPEKIRQDPYALADAIEGIGFLTADRIARRHGFKSDGYPRVRAGLLHALKEAAWNGGHTYLPRNQLILRARAVLNLNPETIAGAITQMVEDRSAMEDEGAIYLPNLYRDERLIAELLKRYIA